MTAHDRFRAASPVLRLGAAAALALLAACAHAAPPAPAPPAPARAPTPAPGLGEGFASRGVIEGFYGPPWTHQDRLDMLRFMGRVGMNTYFYAPKDDPYHRGRWRDPYPAEQIARIGELVQVGRAAGVHVWFAVSPGLSMRYSDDTDYAALLAKLDAVAAVGVRQVGLFLDDVPETLTHPEDRSKFPTLAAAHAYLIRRLKSDLDTRGMALAVVQTTYAGSFGSKDYLRELGAALPADIPLAWTGTDVFPPEMTAGEAREWGAMIRRKPLVWDNYPVNDFARWRLFLGGLHGRGPDLVTAVNGYVANPMNEAHASMLPLWTIADYLRDPAAYDPDRSLGKALVALYGSSGDSARDRRGMGAMRALVAAYGKQVEETGPIDPLYVPARAFDFGLAQRTIAGMRSALDTMRALVPVDSATWAPLVREATPFVDSAGARLARFRADTMYALRHDSLFFRSELDRVVVARARRAPTMDGNLSDWPAAAWRPMFSDRGLAARVAFQADSAALYVAIEVPDTAVVVLRGDAVTAGDQVDLVIGADPTGAATRMSGSDLLLIATPPTDSAVAAIGARSLQLTPFYAAAIAEHADFTFGEFLLSGFSGPVPAPFAGFAAGVAGGKDVRGWRLEISIRRASLPVARTAAGDVLRMAVVASDGRPGPQRTGSLGPRNNAANPATWTEVVLPR